jgi:hypothetical protein
VSEVFDVSREAAEVRLLQRGHLIPLSSGLVCGDASCPVSLHAIGISHFQYSNTYGQKKQRRQLFDRAEL